jgi:hypothetical protein
LDVSAGYNEYCLHPHLSSWYLQSGSGLSFNVAIKDILINLHDNFSYSQNTSANAAVAGTGTYGTFSNDGGVSANWALRYITFALGYDHQNTLATSSQFDDTDNSTEDGFAKVGYILNSAVTAGVEGSASYTAYDQNALNDNTSYSIGVYGTWKPDSFLQVEPRVGYSVEQFEQTSQSLQTSDIGSWYADLNISHQITRSINYNIDVGRNVGLGVQSDADVYWYANGGITWNFIKGFSFNPQFFYQHGNQGQGSQLIGVPDPNLISDEIYNWYGGSIGFTYAITKRFTVSWNYSFTQRTSSLPDRGYTQNIIGMQLSYHPI